MDSNQERRTLSISIGAQKHWKGRLAIDSRKPLFNEVVTGQDGEDRRCRPDFVLAVRRMGPESPAVRIAIETMGTQEPDDVALRQRYVGNVCVAPVAVPSSTPDRISVRW